MGMLDAWHGLSASHGVELLLFNLGQLVELLGAFVREFLYLRE